MTTYTVRCQEPEPYTTVVEVLVDLARTSDVKFSFSSVDIATLTSTGLTLQTDTDSVVEALRQVQGVTVERT